jgi:hypothetical protein
MSRILTLAGALLLFGSFSFAQTANTSTDKSKTQPKEHTIQGCIQQSGDEFMLQTGKHKDIELISTGDLKAHVGHRVKVTGMWDRSADKSEAAGQGHEGHESAAGEAAEHHGMKERHFKVSNVEMVSDTCTATTPKSK